MAGTKIETVLILFILFAVKFNDSNQADWNVSEDEELENQETLPTERNNIIKTLFDQKFGNICSKVEMTHKYGKLFN